MLENAFGNNQLTDPHVHHEDSSWALNIAHGNDDLMKMHNKKINTSMPCAIEDGLET